MVTNPPTAADLRKLLEVLDQTEDDEVREGPASLFRVEPTPDGPGVGWLRLDDHPLAYLMGFVAPPEWHTIGLIVHGWAAAADGGGTATNRHRTRGRAGTRPSRSFGRRRVRILMAVSRHGAEVSALHLAGEPLRVDHDVPVGTLIDALRRSVGRPTPAPEFPVAEYVAAGWLEGINGRARRGRRSVKLAWRDVPQFGLDVEVHRAAVIEGWEAVRSLAATGRITTSLPPDAAAWTDAGMFARWVVNDYPPIRDGLRGVARRVTPEALLLIEESLARLGVLPGEAA
jgi:hypothetical protein